MSTIDLRHSDQNAHYANATAYCGNCNMIHKLDRLLPITDVEERLDIGGEVPAGQCPECDALCYVVVWLK